MQPYVILKRPGKAIFSLLIIMLLFIVKDSYGHGGCDRPCFGPVWKFKFYNELSNGYLHVENRTVLATFVKDGTIYRISNGTSFYLYDANAAKFICWGNKKNPKKQTLVARKYKPHSMSTCMFQDTVSVSHPNSHVNLVASFDKTLKIRFNRNGRFSLMKQCNMAKRKPCNVHNTTQCNKVRHNKCSLAPNFLMSPIEPPCQCAEAKNYFCQTELRNMAELHEICNMKWPRSNETYET